MIAVAQNLSLETPQGPIDVHVTGTGGWNWIDILGPLAIVIAAVAGAVLAYKLATRNVEREMTAADARQEKQLRHDRVIRATDDKRATIDSVTDALTAGINALSDFASSQLVTEQVHRQMDAAETGSEEEAAFRTQCEKLMDETNKELSKTVTLTNALQPAMLRLRLRFPEDHDLYIRFRAAVNQIDEVYELERTKGVSGLRTEEELTAASTAREQIAQRLNEYVVAVRTWVETVIDPE